MKVELHINGSLQVTMIPDTAIERAFLSAMHDATKLGKKVSITGDSSNSVVAKTTFSVEA